MIAYGKVYLFLRDGMEDFGHGIF